MSYEDQVTEEHNMIWRIIKWVMGTVVVLGIVTAAGCPQYNVYSQQMAGRAKLAEAQSSRQVAILEAHAKMEAAQNLAEAEITRARGAATANHILQGSMGGPDNY